MLKLTQEQYDELPELLKDQYKEHEGFYVHLGDLKAQGLKASLNDLDVKAKGYMSELERQQLERDAAVAKAREEALEEARKAGDSEEVKRIRAEQEADLVRRTQEQTRAEVQQEYQEKEAKVTASGIIARIANLKAVDSDAVDSIIAILESTGRVSVVAGTGEKVFKDAKGGAMSVDETGFIAELAKEPVFKRLFKAVVPTVGAGGANGSGSGGASPKNPKDMTTKERIEFKQRDPEGFKRAFEL